jgi:hypothetical protein
LDAQLQSLKTEIETQKQMLPMKTKKSALKSTSTKITTTKVITKERKNFILFCFFFFLKS